ncbi:hypothetical protein FDUTEX481_08408 [Tolypothrix sp. PCC 7601]|nr:hypothetical protein FDUTEX481_08408 [Tolypothrix sp. PCC 7601]
MSQCGGRVPRHKATGVSAALATKERHPFALASPLGEGSKSKKKE